MLNNTHIGRQVLFLLGFFASLSVCLPLTAQDLTLKIEPQEVVLKAGDSVQLSVTVLDKKAKH